MIPNHLNFTPKGNPRPTGIVLALAAALSCAAILCAQQGDTPIVIGDGSLFLKSSVSWASFTGTGNSRNHPNGNKCVTAIDIAMPALSHTLTFDHEKVDVAVTYADTFNIAVTTGPNGGRLAVNTDFGQFARSADGTRMDHNNASGHITHVTVKRGGTVIFDSNASGHSTITIHYQ